MRVRQRYPLALVTGLAKELDVLLYGPRSWDQRTAGDRENMRDMARRALAYLDGRRGVRIPTRSEEAQRARHRPHERRAAVAWDDWCDRLVRK